MTAADKPTLVARGQRFRDLRAYDVPRAEIVSRAIVRAVTDGRYDFGRPAAALKAEERLVGWRWRQRDIPTSRYWARLAARLGQ